MSKRDEQSDQYVVIVFNEKDRIDAAAVFKAKPSEAYTEGKRRAEHAGATKFQIFKVTASTNGNLEFVPVRKSS